MALPARHHERAGKFQLPAAQGWGAVQGFEQLLVDLSWASSRMKGNTYDILLTERLIRFGVPDSDRADVVVYVREQIADLHEGNLIRYRLYPHDLEGVSLR